MRLRLCLVTSAVILATFGLAASARAEIVFLTSNRTLSIKAHRLEGESIILTLRNGGEVTCDKSLIAKIVSDEVPYPPEPETPAAVVAEAAVRVATARASSRDSVPPAPLDNRALPAAKDSRRASGRADSHSRFRISDFGFQIAD